MSTEMDEPLENCRTDSRPTDARVPDLRLEGADSLVPEELRQRFRETEAHRAELEIENAEIRQSRREIEASRDRYAELYQRAPFGYLVLDENGWIDECNLAGAAMLGRSRTDLKGVALASLVASRDRDALAVHISRCRLEATPVTFEITLRTPDGRSLPVQVRAIPHGDSGAAGKPAGCLLAMADVAELRHSRDVAERASRSKGDLLARVSHDLRTPMNALLGMTELALNEGLSPEAREYVETIQESAGAVLTLVNELLDLSRLEAGKISLESAPFRLPALIEETVGALGIPAFQKGLELTCDIADDMPDGVLGDRNRLRQVLTNLIGNAIKFTDRGEVIVRIAVEGRGDPCLVRFEVVDTGIGIRSEDHERIFEPFAQAESAGPRRAAGTGLGLAIASDLVLLMGGRLRVSSRPGEGSSFFFTIPMPLDPAAAAVEGISPDLRERLRGMRALVADDNPTNLRIVDRMLRRWEIQPEVAGDAAAALEKARRAAEEGEPFRLMLIDALMPGMDGFRLAEEIQRDPSLAGTTVLMLSSLHRQAYEKENRRQAIAVYLEKPISQADLLSAIAQALGDVDHVVHAERETPAVIIEGQTAFPRRILLAEDTPANRKLVVQILSKRGHRVEVAENGRQAVEMAAVCDYDLILMDVQMPEMDGLQATSAIRALSESRRARVPIVAMTAYAYQQDQQRCLDAGMDAYLPKPVDRRTLLEMVERLAGP